MRRALTPLWLATPSRLAGLSQGAARIGLALLALLLLATLAALSLPAAQADIGFYSGVADGVRHGGNYYAVTADGLRGGGYPLRPVFAFALPTLAVVAAHLPSFVLRVLLYALVIAAATAWHGRLKLALATPRVRWAATVVVLLALLPMLRPSLILLPETWAGLFVALSLALRRPGQWIDSVALALAAALIRETAILYLLIMLAFALAEGARREAVGWSIAVAVFLAAFAAHAYAVAQVVKPLDTVSETIDLAGFGLAGFGLFVEAAAGSTILAFLPLVIAAPLVGAALFGWAAWKDPTGLRVLVLIVALAVVIALVGRSDTPHWALLIAPLLLPGLIFAVDGVRDLLGTALDRRRITVTRILR